MTKELGVVIRQRLNGLGDSDDLSHAVQQMNVIYDVHVARLIRNTRTGHGEGLREIGFTAVADELGL